MKNFLFLLLFIVAAIGCKREPKHVHLAGHHVGQGVLEQSILYSRDTIHVYFKDDIITLIPHKCDYDVYSEVAEDEHLIDHMGRRDAIRFIMFVKSYPYDASDISDTAMELGVRGYYLELIKEMAYLPAAGSIY